MNIVPKLWNKCKANNFVVDAVTTEKKFTFLIFFQLKRNCVGYKYYKLFMPHEIIITKLDRFHHWYDAKWYVLLFISPICNYLLPIIIIISTHLHYTQVYKRMQITFDKPAMSYTIIIATKSAVCNFVNK